MRVFVTGASGWIGSAVVRELRGAGHEVLGLARSEGSVARVEVLGATAHRGDLDDLDSLRRGARECQAVVHLANKHDWDDPVGSDRAERLAVESLIEALAGTTTPLLTASDLSSVPEGRPAREVDASLAVGPEADRGGTENLVLTEAGHGMVVRFPPSVHGQGDGGMVSFLAGTARERGVSAYVGTGESCWSAVHRDDAARLIRLAVEGAPAGTRLHAVAEQEVSTRAIAEALGGSLGLPVTSVAEADAEEHFGFLAEFLLRSRTASSEATRERLGWEPTGPGLLEDVRAGAYAG